MKNPTKGTAKASALETERRVNNLIANRKAHEPFVALCEKAGTAGCAIHARMAVAGKAVLARFDQMIASVKAGGSV